jgi:hypothetical protein
VRKSFLLPSISTSPLNVIAQHEGGFGRVYIAETVSGDKYALKTLNGVAPIEWSGDGWAFMQQLTPSRAGFQRQSGSVGRAEPVNEFETPGGLSLLSNGL